MSDFFNQIYQNNAGYVEDMFARYQSNPNSVGQEWQAFFSGFQEGFSSASQLAQNPQHYESLLNALSTKTEQGINLPSTHENIDAQFELQVARLVFAWKKKGHLKAKTNPLMEIQVDVPELELKYYQFSPQDLKRQTQAGLLAGFPTMTLEELKKNLEARFAGHVGAEFEFVENAQEREWLYSEFEKIKQPIDKETQRQIYCELAKADALEKTLATKYVGKKRFSIEGADAQIPACLSFMDASSKLGTQEYTVAIAHRGRLNFLVHVIGKPLENLFAEWEGYPHEGLYGDGDVKYHYGYESLQKTRSGNEVRVYMPFNPSHLEYVDSIVMGDTRARQQLYYNSDTNKVASLVFHGDAAVVGQGIVYENAQMMNLSGYKIGGTVHIVANNQVGFTTNPKEGRSSTYCTAAANATGSPVLHVNADDLDALHNVMTLCAKYRARFQKDIYVDLICFRRFGHNEADEPNFTQPLLYKLIKEKPSPYEDYMNYLTTKHGFSADELKEIYNQFRQNMNSTFDKVKSENKKIVQFISPREPAELSYVFEKEMLEKTDTSFSLEKLKDLALKICETPSQFHTNPKIARIILAERAEMAKGRKRIDWGMAELLAYATLAQEGFHIRMSGEDCQRGTFSHRHAVLVDIENEDKYNCLSSINPNVNIEIINSLLSEEAVMGFEYGYSVRNIKALTLWEAQFGDFANGAQVIIDQFIAAGETKWMQQSGLVLLLPHGIEGMGAEHSSARLERFLQLSAKGNMQICYFTKADQFYHALRRQQHRKFRKPLIVMSPKSFLRSPRASCTLEELANGSFCEILDDERIKTPQLVERVLLCTGRIALDLFEALEKEDNKHLAQKIAIIRIEQIYPLHGEELVRILTKYKTAKMFWVQEEPKNGGAWSFIRDETIELFSKNKFKELLYIGRSRRAAPSVGLEKLQNLEQDMIIKEALESNKSREV